MEKLKPYIVTKESSDKTFQIGDIIWLSENDDLNNTAGNGCLSKDEWNLPGTNDFECKLTNDYYIDLYGRRECLRKIT